MYTTCLPCGPWGIPPITAGMFPWQHGHTTFHAAWEHCTEGERREATEDHWLWHSTGPQCKPQCKGHGGNTWVHWYDNSAILYHPLQYSTILYHTLPYCTILYYTLPYSTILYHTNILYHTPPYSTILPPYSIILHHTLSYSTIFYHTPPYSTIFYSAVILSHDSAMLCHGSLASYQHWWFNIAPPVCTDRACKYTT